MSEMKINEHVQTVEDGRWMYTLDAVDRWTSV